MLYRGDIAASMAIAYILECFYTTPAISNPIRNFFCEYAPTCVFILAILGINHSNSGLSGIGAYLVACSVWGIGLSLGGTTGYAINSAHDLGPRIAHALMPMKHKGVLAVPRWIPVLGPIVGALLAVLSFPIIA